MLQVRTTSVFIWDNIGCLCVNLCQSPGRLLPLLRLCKLISLLSPWVQCFLCCTLIRSPFTPSLRPASRALFSLKIFLICQPYMISPVPLNHVFLFEIYLLLSFCSWLGAFILSSPMFPMTQEGQVQSQPSGSLLCPGLTPYHHLRGRCTCCSFPDVSRVPSTVTSQCPPCTHWLNC